MTWQCHVTYNAYNTHAKLGDNLSPSSSVPLRPCFLVGDARSAFQQGLAARMNFVAMRLPYPCTSKTAGMAITSYFVGVLYVSLTGAKRSGRHHLLRQVPRWLGYMEGLLSFGR